MRQVPCGNRYRDREARSRATGAKPANSAPGAHSASRGHTGRHNPGPRSSEFRASAGLRSWRARIPDGSVAGPDLHSAESKCPDSGGRVAPRFGKSAHDQYAEARLAMARGDRDKLRHEFLKSWVKFGPRRHFSGNAATRRQRVAGNTACMGADTVSRAVRR